MPVSCNPSDLIEGAKCYSTCLLNEELSAIELWLLTQIAGTTTDVQTLLNNSKCLENCVEHGNAEAVIVWLLTRIAGVSSDPNSLMSAARCIEACIIPEESKAIDVSLEVQIAGSTTDLSVLLANARCFRNCASDWRGTAVKIWLLATKAGVSTDPATLIGSANCLLGCLNHDQLKLIETYLWCQIANIPIPPAEITPQSFSGLSHWWRADDLAGKVAEAGAVGAAGKEWVCRITGVLASQAVAASQPVYLKAGSLIGGQDVVRFEASTADTDFLTLSAGFSMPGDFTAIAVMFVVSTSLVPINFGFLMGNATSSLVGTRNNPGISYQGIIDSNTAALQMFSVWPAPDGQAKHAVAIFRSGLAANNCHARRNNISEQLLSENGQISVDRLGQASAVIGPNPFQMQVAEIIHYGRSLDSAELLSLYNDYLKPRYTLP